MSDRIKHNHYPSRGKNMVVAAPGECPACDAGALDLGDVNTGLKVLSSVLEGHAVVRASTEDGELELDDGTVIQFDRSESSCCAWFELDSLNVLPNVITKVDITEQYEDTRQSGVGPYKAQISVITEPGEFKYLAEGTGDATSGYYLNGFCLGLTIIPGSRHGETHP